MSLKKFRDHLLERVLTLLWKQWTALGIPGGEKLDKNLVLDPESLLVFSLQIARYEPRLFDEILSWLATNDHWLDASRLRNILKRQGKNEARVVGGALQFALQETGSHKWEKLTEQFRVGHAKGSKKSIAKLSSDIFKQQPRADSVEPLFKEKSGKFHPLVLKEKEEPSFMIFFLNRPPIKNLKEAQGVPVNATTNIRFLLRALFGVGSRSECILYLLTHLGGHPREMAEAIGLFWLGVQQILVDLAASGLVQIRSKANKSEYWIPQKKWWGFLSSQEAETVQMAKWLSWIPIYESLLHLWNFVDELSRSEESDYMKSSKMKDSLEILSKGFSHAGLEMPSLPKNEISSAFLEKFVNEALGKIGA